VPSAKKASPRKRESRVQKKGRKKKKGMVREEGVRIEKTFLSRTLPFLFDAGGKEKGRVKNPGGRGGVEEGLSLTSKGFLPDKNGGGDLGESVQKEARARKKTFSGRVFLNVNGGKIRKWKGSSERGTQKGDTVRGPDYYLDGRLKNACLENCCEIHAARKAGKRLEPYCF